MMVLSRSVPTMALLCATAELMAQNGMHFVENKGQWPEVVTHQAQLPGATVWCERGAILIDRYDGSAINHTHDHSSSDKPNPTVHHHAVRLRFVGGGGHAKGIDQQPGTYNFFQGNDPLKWGSGARAYDATLTQDLYPGVDLRVRRAEKGLKYDLMIAPEADPAAVAFTYDGADDVVLKNDHLIITTSLGNIEEHIPLAYQELNGVRTRIACRYVLRNGVVRFELGEYDNSTALVIDPVLAFSTYSGATTDNFGYSATYDENGFLYGGSSSFGNGYPTTVGAYQTFWAGGDGQSGTTPIPGTDIAVTKYDTTGGFLIWSTMLGGSGDDLPHSLIVNSNHEVIILGTTGSPDFPTTAGAMDASFGGGTTYQPEGIGVSYPLGSDMIVARLSSDGTQLLGSTFLGGSLNDGHNSAAALKVNYADEMRGEVLLDANEDIIVINCTQSLDFPVTSDAPQPVYGGGTHDGVVLRLNQALTDLEWSTFIGGSSADAAFGGALNDDGELFVCGGTVSPDLASTPGAYRTTYQGGQADAFSGRYSADGSSIEALTYYGSTAYDQAYFIDLDQDGNVFLYGQTLAPGTQLIFNAPYNTPGAGQFIAKLDPALGTLLMGSRFGVGDGTLDISPTAFLVDYCNKLYVSGWGSDIGIGLALGVTGMPLKNPYQATTDGNDFYLAVFEVDMDSLYYATFFGSPNSEEHVDGGTSRFDRRGRVYEAVCAGCGGSDQFPTTPGAWSNTNNSSNCNLGVFKFDFGTPLVVAAFSAPDVLCAERTFTFANLSGGGPGNSYFWDFGDDLTSTLSSPTHTYSAPGTYTVRLTASNPNACNGSDEVVHDVVVAPAGPVVSAMNDTLICGPVASITLSANSNGTADDFIWSSSSLFLDTLNLPGLDSLFLLDPAISGMYHVRGSNGSVCSGEDSVNVAVSFADAAVSGDVSLCATDTSTLTLTGIDAGSTILWQPDADIVSGQGTISVSVAPAETTTYEAFVTSPSGCEWTGSATVQVSGLSGSTFGAQVDQAIVLPGTTVQLLASPPGLTYAWSPPALVSNPTIANPTADVQQTTTFTVTVSDGICTRPASVKVEVRDLRCADPDIFVPNTFTPNGDGNNDVLFVRGRAIQELEFLVFDRWGEKVFATTDQAKGWDGTYEGRPVDPAVFVYHLTVLCIDGQRFFTKGNVSVVR
ncbi:MAG TPA: gliding motility-associated C-terminal domain-containing protein [Flavobacteriales bacterium]|nr:gliding motility-associated C-terminal domain-containing protein [Flavobacteriales bacterium]